MRDTIQQDWQYNSLMLASVKDSDHFIRSCMVYSRMSIGSVIDVGSSSLTITYYYVPAAKRDYIVDNTVSSVTPRNSGAMCKALHLLSNIFNKTKRLMIYKRKRAKGGGIAS